MSDLRIPDGTVASVLSGDTPEEIQKSLERIKGTPLYTKLIKGLSRQNLALWASMTLQGPEEPPYNGRFLIGQHHIEWSRFIHTNPRVSVLAPRDHGKSFYFSKAYPIYKALFEPKSLGFLFSSTHNTAKSLLGLIKLEIETNELLRELRPKPGYTWAQFDIKCGNGSIIRARGFGAKVRGGHPQWIVADDCLGDETMWSETRRKRDKDYFYSALTNMIVPTGQICVVGTPFHQNDLYSDLRENPEYTFKRYSAWMEGAPLWPERYSEDLLRRREKEIGSIRWAREFLCTPISDQMSLFPRSLFDQRNVMQHNACLRLPGDYWRRLGITTFMGVDFAMSATTGSDYTVIFVVGLDRFKNIWVVDVVRGRGWEFQRQINEVMRCAKIYDPALCYLEANQFQRIFSDEIVRTSPVPVRPFTTGGRNKYNLAQGVPALRILLENAKVRVPRGDEHSVAMTDLWMREMQSFAWADGKLEGVGSHDDTVMAFWFAARAAQDAGFGFVLDDDGGEAGEDKDPAPPDAPDPRYIGDYEDTDGSGILATTRPKGSSLPQTPPVPPEFGEVDMLGWSEWEGADDGGALRAPTPEEVLQKRGGADPF